MSRKSLISIIALILLVACQEQSYPQEISEQQNREEKIAEMINSRLVGDMSAEEVAIVIIEAFYGTVKSLSSEEFDVAKSNYFVEQLYHNDIEYVVDDDVLFWYAEKQDIASYVISKHTDWHFSNYEGNDSSERVYYDAYMIKVSSPRPRKDTTFIIVDFGSVEVAQSVENTLANVSDKKFDKETITSLSPMTIRNNASRFGFYYDAGTSGEDTYTFYRVLEERLDFSNIIISPKLH